MDEQEKLPSSFPFQICFLPFGCTFTVPYMLGIQHFSVVFKRFLRKIYNCRMHYRIFFFRGRIRNQSSAGGGDKVG